LEVEGRTTSLAIERVRLFTHLRNGSRDHSERSWPWWPTTSKERNHGYYWTLLPFSRIARSFQRGLRNVINGVHSDGWRAMHLSTRLGLFSLHGLPSSHCAGLCWEDRYLQAKSQWHPLAHYPLLAPFTSSGCQSFYSVYTTYRLHSILSPDTSGHDVLLRWRHVRTIACHIALFPGTFTEHFHFFDGIPGAGDGFGYRAYVENSAS
jgi:hypothetical protein